MEYRGRPSYQTNVLPMPNLGPSIQSLGPMVGHMPGDCHMQRQPQDKMYEDWYKYKNALPLSTSGLVSVFTYFLSILSLRVIFEYSFEN